MGCIYRRKNSSCYYIKYYRNGKPHFESTGSDKKEVAERLLKLREGEIAQGKVPGLYYDRVMFDELADAYVSEYKVNDRKTLKKAEQIAGHLKKEFGGMAVTRITTSEIRKYTEKRLDDGFSNATINRYLAALKRMFNLAYQDTPPKVFQIPYIPMLKERNVRKGFFEHPEFLALREELPDYLKPVITFAYWTGWRKSEILALEWDQVDLDEGIVRLEAGDTKNDQARNICLIPEVKELITDLYKERTPGCQFVFHNGGKQIKDFRTTWENACNETGLSGRLFHDFRRTAVRNMVRAGIPERVAMMISGHKTRSVFERYNITSGEDLKEAANKLNLYRKVLESRLQNGYTSIPEPNNVIPFRRVSH